MLLPQLIEEKQVKALTDWYPRYPDGTVRVSLTCFIGPHPAHSRHATREQKEQKPYWRVMAWGYDDSGCEKHFTDYTTAKTVYDALDEPLPALWTLEKEWGFTDG